MVFKFNFIKQLKKILIFLFFLLILINKISLSQVSYQSMKAVLIYKFAENISFPDETEIDTFRIIFYGEDTLTFNELRIITKKNYIKSKPVKISFQNSTSDIGDIQLLYVDESNSAKIEQIWEAITTKNILLVTENCTDAKYIMLNMFYDKKTENVAFEINKANIIIENLSFTPELLLLGGKEIDVRELYQDTKELLDDTKDELNEQKMLIYETTEQLEIQRESADSLRNEITNLQSKIVNGENRLNYLSDSIKIQQKILKIKIEQINQQEEKLALQRTEISKKEAEIVNQILSLDSLVLESNQKQDKIKKQEEMLSSQEKLINKQQSRLIFSITLISVFVILIISGLVIYRIKIAANKKQIKINLLLSKQKTELENALIQLKEAQSQLIQSEKMASLGILTAGIAHEINNPVNYINSGLEGLNTITDQFVELVDNFQQLPETGAENKYNYVNNIETKQNIEYLIIGIKKLVKNIKTGVNKTTDIIKSLNTFSRMDNDLIESADIHKNIDSALILLYNQYKNRIVITKNYDKIPLLNCYSGKLNQVFINILLNAIQAIKDKGEIIISTKISEIKNNSGIFNKFVEISIKDSGEGIAEENINKIFQPFYTSKKVGEGTGLGLAIAHGIIQKHNGKIEVFSKLNVGTEFKIFLPLN